MIGNYYKIKFLDHAKDTLKPVVCICYGKLLVEEETHYGFCWWDIEDEDEEVVNNNREIFCIVKSAVIEMVKL